MNSKHLITTASVLFQFIIISVLPAQISPEWVRFEDGDANGNDIAKAISVDDAGFVIVTGNSQEEDSELEHILTVKYDNTGNKIWEHAYNSSSNCIDNANAITLDEAGNAYIAGKSAGNFLVFKILESDSSLDWAIDTNGTGDSHDEAFDIALDGQGYGYACGMTYGNGTEMNTMLLKFDTSDGSILWIDTFDNSGGFDKATSLTIVDPSKICIAGTAYNGTDTKNDLLLRCYDEAGVLQWDNL